MPSCTISHPLPSGLLYITLTSDSAGLLSIHLFTDGGEAACTDPLLRAVAEQIEAYFAGTLREFNVKISPAAVLDTTRFQRDVWDATKRIPYGETVTYGRIAAAIGRPQSSRAVGNALGRNPLPLIVPCHRVISSSGMGGFSGGGPEIKEFLLGIEGR